jgi:hypothetical protein
VKPFWGPGLVCIFVGTILLDYHPDIAVLVPTVDGIRRVTVKDLMPHVYGWTLDEGSRPVPD